MNSEKSKPFLISIAAVCLISASIVMYMNLISDDGSGSVSVPMFCRTCGHTSEISVKEFQNLISQQGQNKTVDSMAEPQFDCPKCGKKTFQTGIKCSGCGAIFAADFMQNPKLQCPKCGKGNL